MHHQFPRHGIEVSGLILVDIRDLYERSRRRRRRVGIPNTAATAAAISATTPNSTRIGW